MATISTDDFSVTIVSTGGGGGGHCIGDMLARSGMFRTTAPVMRVRGDVGIAVYVTGCGPTVISPSHAAMMRIEVAVSVCVPPMIVGRVNETTGHVAPGIARAAMTFLKTHVSNEMDPACLTTATVVSGFAVKQADMSNMIFLNARMLVCDLMANAAHDW